MYNKKNTIESELLLLRFVVPIEHIDIKFVRNTNDQNNEKKNCFFSSNLLKFSMNNQFTNYFVLHFATYIHFLPFIDTTKLFVSWFSALIEKMLQNQIEFLSVSWTIETGYNVTSFCFISIMWRHIISFVMWFVRLINRRTTQYFDWLS